MLNLSGGDIDNVSVRSIKVVEIFASSIKGKCFASNSHRLGKDQLSALIDLYTIKKADSCHNKMISINCCCPHNLVDKIKGQLDGTSSWVENFDLIVCGCENSSLVPFNEKYG